MCSRHVDQLVGLYADRYGVRSVDQSYREANAAAQVVGLVKVVRTVSEPEAAWLFKQTVHKVKQLTM